MKFDFKLARKKIVKLVWVGGFKAVLTITYNNPQIILENISSDFYENTK
jgi:hypothetical protein